MKKNHFILQPKVKPLIVEGRLSYNENVRCNNILRLKREIREEFSDLQGKTNLIGYRMEFYRTTEELRKCIEDIVHNNQCLPFLLYLFKEGQRRKDGD